MKKQLLIFRHTPIDVDVKMYECFANNYWEGSVIVYAETSFKDCRTACGYQENVRGIQTVIIDQCDITFDSAFFDCHKEDVFLFYGIPLANRYQKYLNGFSIKFGIIAERSRGFYDNNRLLTRIRKAFPFIQYYKYRHVLKNVSCFFAMGSIGVDCYKRYFKISDKVLYSFMYCEGNDYLQYIPYKDNLPIKYVYVGRFDYKFKGVDTMLSAFKNLEGNYVLDLIGDYGDDRLDIIETVSKMPNVNCIGICESDKLCEKLNNYDVIIVPSNYDGWNLHCNLSINSGIGAITTDQAASHELIAACGNGIIVKAGDVNKLKQALIYTINNPSVINEWKCATQHYWEKISYQTIAEYFYNALIHSINNGDIKNKPVAPWI